MASSLRLLLVEDMEDHALLLVRELEKGGIDVTFERVETPQELEAALDARPWDAVIADFNLPTFNGLDALRIMQAKGLDLPFILVSGVIGEEMAVEAMKAGAHDFILKGRLSRLVPALKRELREAAARREHRKAEAELEAFSYSVSHDLRAPLRAVDGYTRILLEEYAPQLDAEGRRICGVISDNTRRMGELIDDLLTFSRLGRVEVHPEPIDMAALAGSTFLELTAPPERERIDFRVGPLPPATGDPALLRQVWANLLANAVKFSAKQERADIEIQADCEGEEVVYSICDNGAGFDMRYVDKLFGVFQRLHSAREFEGTGVGLAIVQRIVHRHGGRVWAEGAAGEGATFYFTLKQGGK